MMKFFALLCLCVMFVGAQESAHPVDEQKQRDQICPYMKPNCPCEVALMLVDTCNSFIKRIDPDADRVNYTNNFYNVRYSKDCMFTSISCTVNHIDFGDQTLSESYQFYPCQRLVTVRNAYVIKDANNETVTYASNATLREGERGIVTVPIVGETLDHTIINTFKMNTTFYMRDVHAMLKPGEYKKSFYTKFIISEFGSPIVKPEWRQVSWSPEFEDCDTCIGGMGCVGTGTTGIVVLSLIISVLIILMTSVLMCRKPVPSQVSPHTPSRAQQLASNTSP